MRIARAILAAVLGLVVAAGRGRAETGDFLCDPNPRPPMPDTCVITGSFTVSDQSGLRFSLPNVLVLGTVTVAPSGRCAADETLSCASDADCCAPETACMAPRCLRSGALTLQADGQLAFSGRGRINARGQAVSGDTVGPDGGSVTLVTRDLNFAGTIDCSAQGTTAIPAGHAGQIVVQASGSVTITSTARLDASTSRGGCGGSIVVSGPQTFDSAGLLSVDGATWGGTIAVAAADALTVSGSLQASNTDGDQRARPPCVDGKGGGAIQLAADTIAFGGSARARGREGPGGTVRLQGGRLVTVDSTLGATPINVSGGDSAAFFSGGVVFLAATAGDVRVPRGAIVADGESSGIGSDAGAFVISATSAFRCEQSGAPCTDAAACAPGEACVEAGGEVQVDAPLSAAGGAGAGSGCAGCEIHGSRGVSVTGPVDVGGGRQAGVGGKVTIAAGADLAIGPGAISASAADGGSIVLVAGERAGAARDIGGTLRIVTGTQLRAAALLDDGLGGDVQIEGCTVTVEATAALGVDGGDRGAAGHLDVVAHETVEVGSLATFSALPAGTVAISYRRDAAIAPDAAFVPALSLVPDPTLPACPSCGNGVAEALEECDGADLEGATCASLGFQGGTLGCHTDCTFDTSQCTVEPCGDAGAGAGDVNGDGAVDIGDALLVAQFAVGLRTCGEAPFSHPAVCDVTLDGACDVGDALRMAQCAVGLVGCDFGCRPFTCPASPGPSVP